jgi:3-oxoacyl-[acyl-carrier-protein] synthase-3
VTFSKILGTGSYFPEKILTNDDLSKIVDTNDSWIVERTGIHKRHISKENERTADMALVAARNALDMAGMNVQDIEGLIFTTITPTSIIPADAAILQDMLGIKNCFSFDLNAACCGFLSGLMVADSIIKSRQCKNIIIVSSERLSTIVNWQDRSTCVLFGDSAGAAVITASTEPGIRTVNLHTDGSHADALYKNQNGFLQMKGSEVFKHAVTTMYDSAIQAFEDCGMSYDDIDIIIPHQANIRIIEAMVKKLGIDMKKVIINLDHSGNTSSATIPTALDEGIRNGTIKTGNNMLLVAVGAGFMWGGAVVTL